MSRHPTHIGRKLYTNTYYICSQYANFICKYLICSGYDCNLIGNMDEILALFNMPINSTIEHRSKKVVHINTDSQEK